VAVPDPTETRDCRAVEPGTRIICLGARWISEEAEQGG
jgi:hypothetical protein